MPDSDCAPDSAVPVAAPNRHSVILPEAKSCALRALLSRHGRAASAVESTAGARVCQHECASSCRRARPYRPPSSAPLRYAESASRAIAQPRRRCRRRYRQRLPPRFARWFRRCPVAPDARSACSRARGFRRVAHQFKTGGRSFDDNAQVNAMLLRAADRRWREGAASPRRSARLRQRAAAGALYRWSGEDASPRNAKTDDVAKRCSSGEAMPQPQRA